MYGMLVVGSAFNIFNDRFFRSRMLDAGPERRCPNENPIILLPDISAMDEKPCTDSDGQPHIQLDSTMSSQGFSVMWAVHVGFRFRLRPDKQSEDEHPVTQTE